MVMKIAHYWFCPTMLNEYPCLFKCEIYCRGILNFSCEAFNGTLCALITVTLLCLLVFLFCHSQFAPRLRGWLTSGRISDWNLFLNTSIIIAPQWKSIARYQSEASPVSCQLFLMPCEICTCDFKRDETTEIVLMESFLVFVCLSTLLLLLWNAWVKELPRWINC